MGTKWDWPFKSGNWSLSSFLSGQRFGYNGYMARPNGYHDGLDFGTVDHAGDPILCVHAGSVVTVVPSGYNGGYQHYVITKDSDNVYCMYQEFTGEILVKVGDKLNLGDPVAYRRNGTGHFHLGINTKKFPTNANPWSPDGWVDPWTTIKQDKLGAGGGAGNNSHKGGSSSGSKSDSTTKDKTKPTSDSQDCYSLYNTINNGGLIFDKWLY